MTQTSPTTPEDDEAAAHVAPLSAARRWGTRVLNSYEQGSENAGDERPLGGYVLLLGVYGALTSAAVLAVRRRGTAVERPGAADLALLTAATFRISRTIAKDAVLAPVRAPFATFQGPGGPGEVMEAPRPGHVRHAVGELLTCPFCMTQWVGTAGLLGLALAPRVTRWVTSGMTAVAAADALHFAYARLQQASH
jgi:hypothetical protein